MTGAVIVAAARTAIGNFGGSLAKVPAPKLGAAVISAVLQKEDVILLPGGQNRDFEATGKV